MIGGKRLKAVNWHRVTDTQGHLLPIQVPAINIRDTIAECGVFEETIKKYRALKGVCADARDRKIRVHFVEKVFKKTIEISEGIDSRLGWLNDELLKEHLISKGIKRV